MNAEAPSSDQTAAVSTSHDDGIPTYQPPPTLSSLSPVPTPRPRSTNTPSTAAASPDTSLVQEGYGGLLGTPIEGTGTLPQLRGSPAVEDMAAAVIAACTGGSRGVMAAAAAAAAAGGALMPQRLVPQQLHTTATRKRRASGDSYDVCCLFSCCAFVTLTA